MSNHTIRYVEEFINDAVNLILEKNRSIHIERFLIIS
jgi:hypothetical protein